MFNFNLFLMGDYIIPFTGNPVIIGQGYDNPLGSHKIFDENNDRRYALDFILPEGTPIIASRGGKIFGIKVSSNINCLSIKNDLDYWMKNSSKTLDYTNYITVDHGDGIKTVYMHLKHNGVGFKNNKPLKVGDEINQGEVIGYSGNTGLSTEPHLHFEVFTNLLLKFKSVKIAFSNYSGELLHQNL